MNTATLRPWGLDRIVEECARRGVRAISPWRDQVNPFAFSEIRKWLQAADMRVFGYCRAGLFPHAMAADEAAIFDDNRRAVDEAAELGADHLILVCGGLPGGLQWALQSKDIEQARIQVYEGIAHLLEHARPARIRLAIEPLHPMFAADRSCINTLGQAVDLCDGLDPTRRGDVGVAVDVYHTWWDPLLREQIARAANRILSFQVSDWRLPTRDLLNDRGMMGDGAIEIRKIRAMVEAAGYDGFNEIEIFSDLDWYHRPGTETLDTCIARYARHV